MKKTVFRRLLTLVMAAVMLLSLPASAFAANDRAENSLRRKDTQEDAPGSAAAAFMELLDKEEIIYDFLKANDGADCVSICYEDDNFTEIWYDLVFSPDYPEIYLFVFDLANITVDMNEALRIVNKLNSDLMYAKFVIDDDDTLTAEMYCYYVDDESAAEIAYYMFSDIMLILTDEDNAKEILKLEK